MKNYRNAFVKPHQTIKETMQIMTSSALSLAIVIDDDDRLLGVATDGDIRRALLQDIPLHQEIATIMIKEPIFVTSNIPDEDIRQLMLEKSIREVPVVDFEKRVVGLKLWGDFLQIPQRPNVVVLMAGGLGSRLLPLTEEVPKPLLKVGDKPILETIIRHLKSYGFSEFIISLNYLSEKIKEYFGDGSALGVNIQYIEEKTRMGTAGALSLIQRPLEHPLIVMNGDLLTTINFNSFLSFHEANQFNLTIGARNYSYQIPYGILELSQNQVLNVIEKPTYRYFVNGGIYLLTPEILIRIPKETHYDMTDLIRDSIKAGEKVGCFPITEYWLDIGMHHDFNQANVDYHLIFDPENQ
jgi:dTDP-glucose pyrophosphorylase